MRCTWPTTLTASTGSPEHVSRTEPKRRPAPRCLRLGRGGHPRQRRAPGIAAHTRHARAQLGCAWRTAVLVAWRRIHQPPDSIGRQFAFTDGTSAAVYRETIIDRLRRTTQRRSWCAFGYEPCAASERTGCSERRASSTRWSSPGSPWLVSKLWLRHDQLHRYRGDYQWDGAKQAVAYAPGAVVGARIGERPRIRLTPWSPVCSATTSSPTRRSSTLPTWCPVVGGVRTAKHSGLTF